jgi:KUP system potassium uptake protein
MPPIPSVDEQRAARVDQPTTPAAALTALGIVYGDLGTSPLYTLNAVVQTFGGELSPAAALGSLSLIVWLLIITISIKYCLFVMRADQHGEGGILVLMSLTGASWHGRGQALIVMGLFGAALLYGDGIVTPAISVLSALEGPNVATNFFKPHVMPMAVAILVVLFAVQSRGTARIGWAFGPVMLVWFVTIAVLGLGGIMRQPGVIAALNPAQAVAFLLDNPRTGFVVLGAVFLAVTGGEALYADMGTIGRKPIRTMWYCLVLPALLLNYAGQTAHYLGDPAITENLFFRLVPTWAIYPMVLLATLATIIASQAIITGTYSMTRQAMQLGWFPGVRIRQTSDEEYGQIYVPFINWTMMVCTVALTVGFATSERLAGAYGTAVSTTMLLTTALLYHVMRERWGWSVPGRAHRQRDFYRDRFCAVCRQPRQNRPGRVGPARIWSACLQRDDDLALRHRGGACPPCDRSHAAQAVLPAHAGDEHPAGLRHRHLSHPGCGYHAAAVDPPRRAVRRPARDRGRTGDQICRGAPHPAPATSRDQGGLR